MNFCFNICNVSFLSYLPLMLCWTIWLMSIWRYFSESFQLKSIPNCIWFIFYLWLWWNCFPCGSAGKEPPAMRETWVWDLGLILELGRFPGEGKGYPLQYSGLENSMDCIDHGVAKSWTWLNDFHFDFSMKLIWIKSEMTLLSQIHSFLSPFKLFYKM